jgi:hypothetical protein
VLETGFGSDDESRRRAGQPRGSGGDRPLDRTRRGHDPGAQIADLAGWIADTSVYVRQSKSDIDDFLAQRPDAPVSSFMEIYDSRQFHPLNDLFHGIAAGPTRPTATRSTCGSGSTRSTSGGWS